MSETTVPKENRLGSGPLVPTWFRLSLPVVLGSIVTIVYNLADTYFIAQTGNALLIAGVSVCAPVFMILILPILPIPSLYYFMIVISSYRSSHFSA